MTGIEPEAIREMAEVFEEYSHKNVSSLELYEGMVRVWVNYGIDDPDMKIECAMQGYDTFVEIHREHTRETLESIIKED